MLGDGKYDHQNNFWILAHNPELFEFKDVHQAPTKKYSFKHLLPAGLKGFLLTALEFDQDQNIWIGSFQGLFFSIGRRNNLKNRFTIGFKWYSLQNP
ncbi:MAG: hypothetical protein IPI77_17800 [Saprospiraceae bacterium]|nr:hypothetical protein [Saprospiraceae bacterium]